MGILTKYVCKNPECENFEKYDHKGFCPECGMKLEKMPNTYVKKLRKDSFNPNRKWRIVNGNSPQDLYVKIEKYEKYGYELIPESLSTTLSGGIGMTSGKLGAGATILTYSVFMKKISEL